MESPDGIAGSRAISRGRIERIKMRLRESLVKGELLDLDTDSGDLFPMHEDQTEATNGGCYAA